MNELETHHSKAGYMNNRLLNKGADGTYVLSLDNDMKPRPKFLLAVLSLVFLEGEAIDGGGRQYRNDILRTQVAFVQTIQYFDSMPQSGRDGFDPAAFVGQMLCSITEPLTRSVAVITVLFSETMATAIDWKKRRTKGAVQILLMQNESEVDSD
ncbi:unnamed protein product [Hyaloperonospora brassicae]|uniref:Glycosyltransferase 2-like domain-containing protein n=1 Tax=Hyaloperonospora brassicae TaxID=162125 RepID=A0AAV0TTX0_HYABA|nr:unnamed protein product [Hyaloperonospora brassicae]